MEIKFGNRTIGLNHPTYFIADIAANHDGDIEARNCSSAWQRKQVRMQLNFRT